MAYASDRQWSDQFLDQVRYIVGPKLLEPAPLEEDTKEATDLIVLRAKDMRIAVRIRRAGFADRYPFEITLRAKRDSGAVTESSKVVDGWGDWLFYGHAGERGLLARWWLVDLHALRAALIRQSPKTFTVKSGDKDNGDGTHFKWFDLRSFPATPAILIAGSHELPALQRANA